MVPHWPVGLLVPPRLAACPAARAAAPHLGLCTASLRSRGMRSTRSRRELCSRTYTSPKSDRDPAEFHVDAAACHFPIASCTRRLLRIENSSQHVSVSDDLLCQQHQSTSSFPPPPNQHHGLKSNLALIPLVRINPRHSVDHPRTKQYTSTTPRFVNEVHRYGYIPGA